jgi:hypothetical protein
MRQICIWWKIVYNISFKISEKWGVWFVSKREKDAKKMEWVPLLPVLHRRPY